MEQSTGAPTKNIGRKEPSIDPVKAQGVLTELTKKERRAARKWPERWGFYKHIREIQEEEAQNLGMTLEEYRTAVRTMSCQAEPKQYPVEVEPTKGPLPPTTNGTIGRRAQCPLERYGRLVMTSQEYPIHPPRLPPYCYDPYKQTIFFLGSISDGDPISYKLPPSPRDVTGDSCLTIRPDVLPFNEDILLDTWRMKHIQSYK